MKLRKISLAAGLALSMFSGVVAAIGVDISSGSAGFVNTPPAGAFVDVYTFNLALPTTLTGIVTSAAIGNQDVDFTSLSLTGPSGALFFTLINPDPFEIWTLSTGTLTAGAYTLTLTGTNSAGVGTYSGNIAIAVPEPETYALMMVGMAGIGLLTMRRRS